MKLQGKYKISLMVVLFLALFFVAIGHFSKQSETKRDIKVESKAKPAKKPVVKKNTPTTVTDDKAMVGLKKFNYADPSESKDYPDLAAHPNAWIDVDIATQRTYIKDGKTDLYEMYASTGKHDTTPRGTYYVQNERGNFFYTQPLKMGAYYYVSFLNHGEYLFHTTPTDVNGKYDEKIAKTLGREPSSHGCIHLSIADCKWVYDNIPSGTKVVIHGTYKG